VDDQIVEALGTGQQSINVDTEGIQGGMHVRQMSWHESNGPPDSMQFLAKCHLIEKQILILLDMLSVL